MGRGGVKVKEGNLKRGGERGLNVKGCLLWKGRAVGYMERTAANE